ncbi:MAG: hypothetical protein ACQEXV_25285 [Bacillota bacterium]
MRRWRRAHTRRAAERRLSGNKCRAFVAKRTTAAGAPGGWLTDSSVHVAAFRNQPGITIGNPGRAPTAVSCKRVARRYGQH